MSGKQYFNLIHDQNMFTKQYIMQVKDGTW
jgi:hypothetical protein